jgi:hypothetical protein
METNKKGVKLGKAFDRLIEWVVIIPLSKIFKVSLRPSQSRWGFQAGLLALGLFSVALASQYQSGGNNMLVFWILGGLAIFIALCTSIYFLRHQDQDQVTKDIASIKADIGTMNQKLEGMSRILQDIKDLLEKQRG